VMIMVDSLNVHLVMTYPMHIIMGNSTYNSNIQKGNRSHHLNHLMHCVI